MGKKAAALIAAAALSLGACSGPTPKPAPPKTAPSVAKKKPIKTISPYPKPTKSVYLTFDDGPGEFTPQVLKILKDKGVKATFFVIGRQIAPYEKFLKDAANAGMGVEVHTWDHINVYTALSARGINHQIAPTAAEIKRVTGNRPTCVRPPQGATGPRTKGIIKNLGYKQSLWEVDTEDWSLPGSKTIAQRALGNVTDGSIILMHDGGGNRSQTVKALPEIIHGLKKRGYNFKVLCAEGQRSE